MVVQHAFPINGPQIALRVQLPLDPCIELLRSFVISILLLPPQICDELGNFLSAARTCTENKYNAMAGKMMRSCASPRRASAGKFSSISV